MEQVKKGAISSTTVVSWCIVRFGEVVHGAGKKGGNIFNYGCFLVHGAVR